MAKEKKSVELRAMDEVEKKESRLYRLNKNTVEEVEIIPTIQVGEKILPAARLTTAGKAELKPRSIEPDMGALIERDAVQPQDLQWETSEPSKSMPWGWMALVGCVFAVGILWSLVEVNRSDDRREGIVENAKSILEREKGEEMEAEKPPVPLRVQGITTLDPLTVENRATFWMVLCELEDGSTGQLLVETLSPGVAKVDWETFFCYQPMKWEKFAEERPEGYTEDFRVYVETDSFFSHEFADSDVFACFRLTALDGDDVLFGYIGRGSELTRKLENMIKESNGAPVPMILRLSVPEGAQAKRSVAIRKLVCPRWLYVESPESNL